MNSDYEKHLEKEIDRELKDLPELTAPDTLIPRVMETIARQAVSARRPRGWQQWPLSLQVASLLVLLAMFGGVCFAAGNLSQITSLLTHETGGWFAGWTAVWNTLGALAGTAVPVAKQLGNGFIIGGLIVAALSYAMCVGLGTAFARFIVALQRN